MKLLLSIHSEHAENIFKGLKTIEYRKNKINCLGMTVFFYETSPKQKVTGQAIVSELLVLPVSLVWQKTYKESGAKRADLIKYYKDKEFAYCYKLINVEKFKTFLNLEDFGIKNAPQSYCFLKQ